MSKEQNKSVSMDMREQIFDLLKERMNIADNHFTTKNWELCLYECINIQSKIDRLIDGETRRIIDDIKEKILNNISVASINARTVSEKNTMIEAYTFLPILVDYYKTTLNNVLFDAGILYPLKTTGQTMLQTLSEENFSEDKNFKSEYLKEVMKLSKEEIISYLSLKMLEDIYTKAYIKNVLQE
jgi:hypothetical protein